MDAIPLGKSSLNVAPIGLGTWSWGDVHGWEFGRTHVEKDLKEVVAAAVATGTTILFDTAESYAGGQSEILLGNFLREFEAKAVIATKFSPRRFEFRQKDLLDALRGSLRRLGVDQIDLYQIHWPTKFGSVESRMSALADAFHEGLIRAAGVSNFSRDQVLRAGDALGKRGIPLTSVQVEYSLLHRAPEANGILQLCRELNIKLIAYSPLAMGMLTGKYNPDRLPSGFRALKYPAEMQRKIQPIIHALGEIGEECGGKTPAQVALNWIRSKGALPIPGAKTGRQAEELLGSIGWDLTESEVNRLDALSVSISVPG
jgi:aryl-alcohol dehydrogenase-like predicted oxidoreductase